MKTARAKFLISEPEILQAALKAAKETKVPRGNIWIFDVHGQPLPAGWRTWGELLTHGEDDWVRFNDLKTAQQTTAGAFFSSGTTGLPKAVVTTHHNLVAQHELTAELRRKPFPVSWSIWSRHPA
jgi:acyl-coenzyme A synthetase/AMP-(fatty) acid ligase